MTETQKKITYYCLMIAGITLMLFVVIFNACVWTEGVSNEVFVYDDCAIALSVLVPFLTAINCFLSMSFVKVMSDEEAIAKLAKLKENGKLTDLEFEEAVDKVYANREKEEERKIAKFERDMKIAERKKIAEKQSKQRIVAALKSVDNGEAYEERKDTTNA